MLFLKYRSHNYYDFTVLLSLAILKIFKKTHHHEKNKNIDLANETIVEQVKYVTIHSD